MTFKYLVYFVIGGERDYANLLEYCCKNLKSFPENDVCDILVLCDRAYADVVNDLSYVKYVHVTPDNQSTIHVSMRKVEIFEFRDILSYDKVLYLDCDIVVHGSLLPLFDSVVDETKLYVVPETKNFRDHENGFYCRKDKPYDSGELRDFAKDKVYVFNAGQFAFRTSSVMRGHFTEIARDIRDNYNRNYHFYEQSHLNSHFNRSRSISYAIENFCRVDIIDSRSGRGPVSAPVVIHHLANATKSWSTKLNHMKESWSRVEKVISRVDTRSSLDTIVVLPPNPHIAEIGTFRGQFAQRLLDMYKPTRLFCIDPWFDGPIMSGNQDGNDVETFNGYRLYLEVREKFAHLNNVTLIREFSQNVTEIRDVDMVYIDGDHSYEGVRRDLLLAWKWVKHGGWICGHDYEMNPAKTKHTYDFGVKRAVGEFCKDKGVRIWYLCMDGCVSFCIRK